MNNKMPTLTTGMRVIIKGEAYLVVKELEKIFSKDGFMYLSSFDEQGKYKEEYGYYGEWDIESVYSGEIFSSFLDLLTLGTLLWAQNSNAAEIREKQKVLTLKRKECDDLEYEIEQLKQK